MKENRKEGQIRRAENEKKEGTERGENLKGKKGGFDF